MKKHINRIFSLFGYKLINVAFREKLNHVQDQMSLSNENTMTSALKRLQKLGIQPEVIIDLGAAKGKWTEIALSIWQSSNYKLVEPLKEQINNISQSLKLNKGIEIFEGVAGSDPGKIVFTMTDDLDGSGVYGGNGNNTREVRVLAVDEIMKKVNDVSVLLKLDTHGYEIPIFEGAKETLKCTEAIIVEVYGFHVSPTGKLFHQVSTYLADKGFRLFDIVDVRRRPKDNAFWQADAIYLKSDYSIFSNNSYR